MQRRQASNLVGAGHWALVTGASSGIGEAIAVELAGKGMSLVLVARRLERLQALADRLQEAHGVRVLIMAADLTQTDGPQAVHRFIQEHAIEIDVLVNNAGVMHYGEFWQSDLAGQLAMIQLNCQSVLHLTHLFVQGMVARRAGKILIVSTTTLAPAPYVTTYSATKGFDLLFAEGLAEELAHHGIGVSILCPGPTLTGMGGEHNGGEAKGLQSAQAVAHHAVQGLMAGKRYIRPSFMASVMANLPRFLPRATISGATEQYYRPGSVRPWP